MKIYQSVGLANNKGLLQVTDIANNIFYADILNTKQKQKGIVTNNEKVKSHAEL